jgi:hypothetical protein
MRSCFLSLVDVAEFHIFEKHPRLSKTGLVYNVNKLPELEEESVIVLIKSNILTEWDKI